MVEHFRKITENGQNNIDESMLFIQSWYLNLDITDKMDNRMLIIIRLCQLMTFKSKGQYEEFFTFLEDMKVLPILISGYLYSGRIYREIASVAYLVGIEEIALKYAHRSFDFFAEGNNSEEIARSLLVLGNSYGISHETNLQMNYYQKCLELSMEINNKNLQIASLNNIAHTAVEQNRLDLAMDSINKSIELLDEDSTDKNLIAVYLTKSCILNKKKLYQQAKSLIIDKVLIQEVNKNVILTIECFKLLGEVYLAKKEYAIAENYYKKGLILAQETKSDKYIKEMNKVYSVYYEKIENYKLAFFHYRKYHSYKNKIENQQLKLKSTILKVRFKTKNALKKAIEYKNEKTFLKEKLSEIQTELVDTQKVSVYALATLIEFREDNTGNHVLRITNYVKLICRLLSHYPQYSSILTDRYIDEIARLSSLHDIGKITVSDAILNKKGLLNEVEFDEIKQHTVRGKDALVITGGILNDKSFLKTAQTIAFSHHEKWDGSGYPLGLTGENIPLEGRIVGIADCFDALINKRPYRKAYTSEQAISIIEGQKGKHFDPVIAQVFLENIGKFIDIALLFSGNKGNHTL